MSVTAIMEETSKNEQQSAPPTTNQLVVGAMVDPATNNKGPPTEEASGQNTSQRDSDGVKGVSKLSSKNEGDSNSRRFSIDPSKILDEGDADIILFGEGMGKQPPAIERIVEKIDENEETASEGNEVKLKPRPRKLRFKQLAGMIKLNLRFANTLKDKLTQTDEEETEEGRTYFVDSGDQGKGEMLVFDANSFKAKNRSYGGLSQRARRILIKHPYVRSDDELLLLKDVIDRLKCFTKYSRKVKHELARVIFYENVDSGRVIIQQGHVGMSFYFIVSGTVVVKSQETNKETGQKMTTILGELSEGASFGELALLHNIRRQATIASLTDTELLRVDKEDFEAVLRQSYEREWNERLRTLSKQPIFSDINKQDLRNCNQYCKLTEFASNTVIYGDTVHQPDYVSFIAAGEVTVVRQLYIQKDYDRFGKVHFKLPTDTQLQSFLQAEEKAKKQRRKSNLESSKNRGSHERYGGSRSDALEQPCSHGDRRKTLCGCLQSQIEMHYWTVGIFGPNFYYGTGENLLNTYLICKTRVEVLFVPRVQFMKLGLTKHMDRLRDDLNRIIPTNEKLFKSYFEECDWDRYKQQEVEEIIRRRHIPNVTRPSDVPYTIRLGSWRIGHKNYD